MSKGKYEHMNDVELDFGEVVSKPTVGSIAPGTVFQFPSGLAAYIRTDNRRLATSACVHLSTGVTYWVEDERPVLPFRTGAVLRITVNRQL